MVMFAILYNIWYLFPELLRNHGACLILSKVAHYVEFHFVREQLKYIWWKYFWSKELILMLCFIIFFFLFPIFCLSLVASSYTEMCRFFCLSLVTSSMRKYVGCWVAVICFLVSNIYFACSCWRMHIISGSEHECVLCLIKYRGIKW